VNFSRGEVVPISGIGVQNEWYRIMVGVSTPSLEKGGREGGLLVEFY